MSQSPTSFLDPKSPLFKTKMTNAEALKRSQVKQNNFLRASINAAGQEQVHSKRSSSSKGLTQIRTQLKRGTKKDKRGGSVDKNDFAFQSAQLKDEFNYSKTKRIIRRKVSKSPAVFRLDGDSPYMEYLPDRYREYKPKEKKLKTKNSNVSLNDFFKKVDKAYSDVHSVGLRSRSGSRDVNRRLSRKGSNNKSLVKMSTFRSQSSVSSRGGKSIRSNPSKLRKRPKKSQSSNDDSFMRMANLVKQKVYKNKA